MNIKTYTMQQELRGLSSGASDQEAACPCRSDVTDVIPSLGREDPLGEEWQPTPVFLPGESHG